MTLVSKLARLAAAAVIFAAVPALAQNQPGGLAPTPQADSPPLGGPVDGNPAQPGPGIPRDDILDVMVRRALLTFNDANISGNYNILSTFLHPDFRQQVPPARFAEIFKAFRDNKIDIAPLLAHKTVYSESPSIDADGLLHAKGQLETRPWRTTFDLAWRRQGDRWWLWKINVRVRPPEQ
ncbi:MAG: hypothetical protein JNM29_21665 [Candidatus Odyssella sp.]|nr:hypothetical protein [Candidatus Odyssella sp.]